MQFGPALVLLAATWASAPPAKRSVLEPNLLSDEIFAENFTVIADLEDSTYLQIGVTITNIGPGDANGYCYAYAIPPRDKAWVAANHFDREAWSFTDGAKAELKVGTCRLVAGEKLTAIASLEGSEITIEVDAAPASIDTPERHFAVGEGFFESDLFIPWARAKGTLKLADKPAVTLAGHGYADHSRSVALPAKIARMWIRFRGLAEQGSSLLEVRYPPSGEARGYSWVEGQDKAAQPIRRVKVGRKQDKDKRSPPEWRVLVETHDKASWRITTEALLHRDAPVEQYGVAGKIIGKIIGNMVTYTYRAVLEDPSGKRLRGIFEAELQE
jgi:hypothetical protein